MLNHIIAFSIRNKLIVGLFLLALLGYGLYETTRLPIDAVPDITNNQVQVITQAPALGAPDVERLITFPIEQANSNIPGLIEQRSFSRFGLSVVTLVFSDETDIYWARQQVSERLKQAQELIPKGTGSPVLAPLTTGLGEIYQYTVRTKPGYEGKYSPMELRTIQDWIVRRQLLGVEGVAEVSSFGGLLKQYEIAVDPSRLMANHTHIGEVFQALESNNQNTGGAYIEKGGMALFIRSEGLAGTADDIRNMVVKTLPGGMPLLIRDVAEVRLGYATRYGAMTFNGQSEVSGAVVMMLKGANSNVVIRNIRERIERIRKTLPEGVEIDPFLDRTKMVNNAIGTVSTNLLEGALIVVFVLVLLLGNFRAGLLVASVIPLSMLFAIILMNLFGVSGNLMSLGALDFGLIVDGAVIIVEAVMHRLALKGVLKGTSGSQREMDMEVNHAASRMMNSAVFGQIIILVVYLPIFTLQGIEGKMFKPMAQTVAFALAGAFLLSLTYIPMMSALFLRKTGPAQPTFSDRMMHRLEQLYRKYLIRALRKSKPVLLVVVLLFAGSVIVLFRLGGEFIPSLPEGDLAVEMRVLTCSNLQTSVDASNKAAAILLKQFPEVEEVVGKTGNSEVPTDPMPMNATDLMVILKKRSAWTTTDNYADLEAKMAKALAVVPGVTFGFQYPVAMRFNELMTGARQDVVCKLFGENLDTLAFYGSQLSRICGSVDGSTGIYLEAVTGMPQIVVRYNRAAIAQFGLNITDINRVLNTAFAGESSGMVYEGERRFDLVVRLSGEKRKDLADVQNLLIPTAAGTQIPLSTVASVDLIDGPNQIQRENSQRRLIVGFNVRGRDVQSLVHELQQRVTEQLKLPPGYYITYGGAFENLEAAKSRLYVAVPVSLLLILLLLYFAFGSVKQGLLIYSAIPLSAIGGILALALRGIPFSISAGVGFIALFGVAVLNGIVLIAEFNRLRQSGYHNLQRIVLQGTGVRLRPVLITALVASLGFLPMALSRGEGAEVQRPLATVVIGGLLIATFLTLFVLPALYIRFQGGMQKRKPLAVVPLLLLGLLPAGLNAQTPVTLAQAIDTALKNNLQVKNESLQAAYQERLKKTAADIPQTQLTGQYGQYNSVYYDNQIGVAQSLSFPAVYFKQKSLQQEIYKNSLLSVQAKEAELRREVARMYYLLVYADEKWALLQQTDNLVAAFLNQAQLRFEKGESNILERTTAETQRGQIAVQLNDLKKDREVLQLQFRLLLQTETHLVPAPQAGSPVWDKLPDTSAWQQHPRIKMLGQEQAIARTQTGLQRARLLPDLSVGYTSTTIRGIGADDVRYSGSNRFSYVHFGIGVPVFSGSQRARVASGKIQQQIADNNLRLGLQAMQTEYTSALKTYETQLENLRYLEHTALPNAQTLVETANRQFAGGDISYLEWVLLINNATGIRSQYAEVRKELNLARVQLAYLTQTPLKD